MNLPAKAGYSIEHYLENSDSIFKLINLRKTYHSIGALAPSRKVNPIMLLALAKTFE